MLRRVLFFANPCKLSLKDCQMVVSSSQGPEATRTIPIEDIGFVILEDPMINITLPLLNALSDNNVALVICGSNRMPNAMLMSLEANTVQAEVYRDQIDASEPLKKNLWKQIVEAKIKNQAKLLSKLNCDGEALKSLYSNVKSGDSDNREGAAARLYWKMLFGESFFRDRNGSGPNSMLNYGYTILRAAVARALMGSGLFPAFGIFHRNRYNAFPLADDIMEPYRVYVDELVFKLFQDGVSKLTTDTKLKLGSLLFTDTCFKNRTRPLNIGISTTTASLAKCFAGEQKKIIYPVFV